jgi:hypothetical protein
MITESQIENVAKMKHSGKTRVENNQEVPALCPDVPESKGNSLEAFLALKTQKNKAVPPCSPFSLRKEDIRSIPKQDPGYRQYICIYNNNRGERGNKGEHGDFEPKTRVAENQRGNTRVFAPKTAIQAGTKPTSDPRFRSQKFRDAVHYCLDFLGLPHTMTEFRRLDSQLNWIELARNLSGQRYTGPEYDLEIVVRDFPGKISDE